ncbi:MAG: hypothetical protein KJ620_09240, partial [Candidatus Edwardsbacteria bacterium]|nr:hypothetical protein [Candidatus Edwardsbacteria bacterium]MBU1576953.1 hypothetical protein [Candidatus Edwardsbacteria bacterium]
YLDIAIKNNEKNYSVWLLKAIIDFMVSKNVEESFKSIGKAELYAKNTHEWRYSKAFLYFWIADYPKAIDLCQKIKTQNYINENVTLEEVRAFNLNLLKQPLPKAQLYFWIGYLSYHKVNNLINALQDFEMFEKLADASMYILKNRSSAYLIEIKQKLKKKPSLE